MIFKLIDSEESLSGYKLNVNTAPSIKNNTSGVIFNSDFSNSLNTDKKSLEAFIKTLDTGGSYEDALAVHMGAASQAAIDQAEKLKGVSNEILNGINWVDEFTQKQKAQEVSIIATNKSFMNCKSLINEYNSNCKNVGLTQQQFIESVGSSNNAMGKYLAGLNGAQASFGGYAKALVGAKLQTIGLQAASMALNAVIGMGIGLAISAAIKGIDYLIHRADNLIQKGEDAANTIKSIRNVWNIRQK